jgi:hypothetical protein
MAMELAIFKHHEKEAHQYAETGLCYAKEALEAKRLPRDYLSPFQSADQAAGEMHIVAHACGWYLTRMEMRDELTQAAKRLAKHVHSRKAINNVTSRAWLLYTVHVAMMAGEFSLAHNLFERFPKKFVTTDIHRPEYMLSVLDRHFTQNTDESRLVAITLLRDVYAIWARGDTSEIGDMLLSDATMLSYIGARYFDELALADMTYPKVLLRLSGEERI